jgi:hypothetical protein
LGKNVGSKALLVVNDEASTMGKPRDDVSVLVHRDDVEECLGEVLGVWNGSDLVRSGQC